MTHAAWRNVSHTTGKDSPEHSWDNVSYMLNILQQSGAYFEMYLSLDCEPVPSPISGFLYWKNKTTTTHIYGVFFRVAVHVYRSFLKTQGIMGYRWTQSTSTRSQMTLFYYKYHTVVWMTEHLALASSLSHTHLCSERFTTPATKQSVCFLEILLVAARLSKLHQWCYYFLQWPVTKLFPSSRPHTDWPALSLLLSDHCERDTHTHTWGRRGV